MITLHYSPYIVEHWNGAYTEQKVQASGQQCTTGYTDITYASRTQAQRLDSIKSAQHTIRFSTSLRSDALKRGTTQQQEPKLDLISVRTPGGTVLRQFGFSYGLFGGNRLRLNSVTEKDASGTSLPPYSFSYDAQTFPDRTSKSQDHWGYWNGKSNSTLLPTVMLGNPQVTIPGGDRAPDTLKVKVGSLAQITWPTGGTTSFAWQAHDYGSVGNHTDLVDLGPPQSASVSSIDTYGYDTESIVISGSSVVVTVSVSISSPPCNPGGDWEPCPFVEIIGKGYWTSSGSHQLTLAPGTYTLRSHTDLWGASASASATWQYVVPVTRRRASGLRIAQITHNDGMGTPQSNRVTKYAYTMTAEPARSSGTINAEPAYTYSLSAPPICSYWSRASQTRSFLGDGPVVLYREVAVLHGSAGEFGRTLHTFRSYYDQTDAVDTDRWPYFRPTSYGWKRGQETSVEERNSSGQPQEMIAKSYQFEGGPSGTTREFRGLSVNPMAANYIGSLTAYNYYRVYSAWMYPDREVTTRYTEAGSSPFSSVRRYTYGNAAHLQPTMIVEDSGGVERITRLKYPADYASGTTGSEAQALTAMKADSVHNHSAVVEYWVSEKTGGVERVVAAELTTYRKFATQQYRPYQRFVLGSPGPVGNFVVSAVSGSFTKDSRYLVTETVDSVDAYGRPRRLTDGRGHVTRYTYNGGVANALLTQISRAGSPSLNTDISYDTRQNVASIRDEGGTYTYYTHDSFDRLRQIKDHNSTVIRAYGYTYGLPSMVADTQYLSVSPLRRSVTRTYLDGLGAPVQTLLVRGSETIVTATEHDAAGREWRRWKPFSQSSESYNAAFATSATSFYNSDLGVSNAKPYVELQYKADASGRLSRRVPEFTGTAGTQYTSYTYGTDPVAKRQYTEATDALGRKTREHVNVHGDTVTSILGYGSPQISTTTIGHDGAGRRTQVTDPRGLITRDSVDTRGLLRKRVSPDAGVGQWKHDRNGNMRYSQDAVQATAGRVLFRTYDFANRPLVDGTAIATFTSLDPDAAPAAFESTAANWVRVRTYDAKPTNTAPWSSFWAQISPLTLTNVSGRLAAEATKSNGAWQVILYGYDTNGRVVSRYVYTQNETATGVLTAVNTTESRTYDLAGNLTYRVLTVGSSSWYQWMEYHADGQLWKVFASTSATKPGTADVTYTYRPTGQIASRQFAGGPSVPFTYTIREELARIGDPASTSYPFSARYAYHGNGRMSEMEFYSAGSPASQKRYRYLMPVTAYDSINRLKSADYSGWTGSAWSSTAAYDINNITYDAAGNIRTFRRYRSAGTVLDNLTYTYPSGNNRLSSLTEAASASAETWDAEAGSFTYDANGNIVTAPAPYSLTASSYDHRNQPISFTRGGVTTKYRYTGDGWRISKRVGTGNTEVYIQDGPLTLAVFTLNSAGTATSWYFNVVAGARVVGRHPSAGTRVYYHTDLLGTVRAVVQATTVVESYDYDLYGVLMDGRALAGSTTEGFSGKERDPETGLDYFGQRSLMTAFGRWSTVDPVADSFPEWNPYNYVEGNPVTYTDPFGLYATDCCDREQLAAALVLTTATPIPGDELVVGALLGATVLAANAELGKAVGAGVERAASRGRTIVARALSFATSLAINMFAPTPPEDDEPRPGPPPEPRPPVEQITDPPQNLKPPVIIRP